ncbi:MAG TPA: hypothetical protein VGN15_14490, partial [Ktedonobacteraceae bacterium]|nr:hypothetical protein [Ktedonobacteraceae bacterium]
EQGVNYLKDVQARLANGNMRVRARLTDGELLPLAASLNLMADRLMRLEHSEMYAQRLSKALTELSIAVDRYRMGGPFLLPPSASEFAEINNLILAMGLKDKVEQPRPAYPNRAAPSGASWPGRQTWPEQPQKPSSASFGAEQSAFQSQPRQ